MNRIPRLFGMFSYLQGILIGILCILAAIFLIAPTDAPNYIATFFVIFGVVSIILSIISFMQLKNHGKHEFVHHGTNTAVNYVVPKGVSYTTTDGKHTEILGWVGPVHRLSASWQILANETVNGGENTIFITPQALVFFMILPDEGGKNLDRNSRVGSDILATYPANGFAKTYFSQAFTKNWPRIVEAVLENSDLSLLGESHFNFVIPYGEILEVKVRQSFFNSGFHIRLRSGEVIKYFVPKNQLDQLKLMLRGRCTIVA